MAHQSPSHTFHSAQIFGGLFTGHLHQPSILVQKFGDSKHTHTQITPGYHPTRSAASPAAQGLGGIPGCHSWVRRSTRSAGGLTRPAPSVASCSEAPEAGAAGHLTHRFSSDASFKRHIEACILFKAQPALEGILKDANILKTWYIDLRPEGVNES